MPDRQSAGRPRILADLQLTLSDTHASTGAHVGSAPDGLVLDLEDAPEFLRLSRLATVRRGALPRLPDELRSVGVVDVRSRGQRLGRLHATARGHWRFLPTVPGVRVLLPPLVRSWIGQLRASRARVRA